MQHSFDTASNLLIKIAAHDRPANMTHDMQMIYGRTYFKGMLASLIVCVPEVRDYIEKIAKYHENSLN